MSTSPFVFDELRATQAAAVLVSAWGGRADYATVLKLLFLADQRSIVDCGVPVTGRLYERRDYEPTTIPHAWDRFFATEGTTLVLLADPGDEQLSDYDVEVLQELWAFYDRGETERRLAVRERFDRLFAAPFPPTLDD